LVLFVFKEVVVLVAVCIYSLAAGSAEKAAINLVDAFNYYGH
jgi:hypothetical protein